MTGHLSISDSFIRGFEVPLLAIFSSFIEGSLNEMFFSRCISKLIVICNEQHADKIVPSNISCHFAQKIEVYGLLYLLISLAIQGVYFKKLNRVILKVTMFRSLFSICIRGFPIFNPYLV